MKCYRSSRSVAWIPCKCRTSADSPEEIFVAERYNGGSSGHNPFSDAPFQNPSVVLNGKGSGHPPPLSDALYLDLDTVTGE